MNGEEQTSGNIRRVEDGFSRCYNTLPVLLFSDFNYFALAFFVHFVGKTERFDFTAVGGLYSIIADTFCVIFQIGCGAIGVFANDIKYEVTIYVELFILGYTGEVRLGSGVQTETDIAGEIGVGACDAPGEVVGTEILGGNLVLGIEIDYLHVVGAIQRIRAAGGNVEGIVDFDFNKFLVSARARTGFHVFLLLARGESGAAEKDGGNHQCNFSHDLLFNYW